MEDKIELIVMIGVVWNAGLQTLWYIQTKDKHDI